METRTNLLVGAITVGLGLAPGCIFNPGGDQDPGFETFVPPTTTAVSTGVAEDDDTSTPGMTSSATSSGDATGMPDGSSGVPGSGSTGEVVECGDGIVGGDEACDDAGESATCNDDCTAAACGDGLLNMAAGELCDDGAESATCDVDCTPAECGDAVANATAGEACDDAGETAACDADCTPVECGDGLQNGAAGEACDDGNMIPGDGCEGCLVVVACGAGATMLATNLEGDMVVCDDPTNTTCEQDAEMLCPAGWGLCTLQQHHNRNANIDFAVGGGTVVVGEIHCRASSGAGHYTLGPYGGITNLNQDIPLNCGYGSSRESCVTGYGCNELTVSALCCGPDPDCGNGVVDAPEELCDDANAIETDDCLDSCGWRQPGAQGIGGC